MRGKAPFLGPPLMLRPGMFISIPGNETFGIMKFDYLHLSNPGEYRW